MASFQGRGAPAKWSRSGTFAVWHACGIVLGLLSGTHAAAQLLLVSVPDTYSVDEDTTLNVPAPGVLANDFVQPLTAALETPPANGSLTLTRDGSFTYRPSPDFNGSDSFTYRAVRGSQSGTAATVTITINPLNDPPAFTSTPPTTVDEDAPYEYIVTASDPEGDALTFAAPTLPGWLAFNAATRTLAGTPRQTEVGAHSIVLSVSDGIAPPVQQTFQLTVAEVNQPPQLLVGEIEAPNATESVPYEFDVGGLFKDPDGETLYYAASGLPASLAMDEQGRIFGTPTFEDASGSTPLDVTVTVRDRPNADDAAVGITRATFPLVVLPLDRVDIALTAAVDPDPAIVDADVSWRLTLINASELVTIEAATIEAELAGTPFVLTDSSGCTGDADRLSCRLGPIPPQGSVVQTIGGRATQQGDVLLRAHAAIAPVLAGPIDPNADNDAVLSALSVAESFSVGPAQTLPTAAAVHGVAAGDVDGDGYLDLVATLGGGIGTYVYLSEPLDASDPQGEAHRRLSATPLEVGDTGVDGRDVLLADLDGDGGLDLISANDGGNTVYLNRALEGELRFEAAGAPLGGGLSRGVTAADFDGNGFADLVFANQGPDEVYLNQGDGSFAAPIRIEGGGDSRSVVIADFDGDSLPDIAFADGEGASRVYRNAGGGAFADPVHVGDEPAISIAAADVSGDGRIDIVLGRQWALAPGVPSDRIHVSTSVPGSIRFVNSGVGLGAAPTMKVVTGDVSLDGEADIVALNVTGTHQVFVGTGNSSFALHPEQFLSGGVEDAETGDFNNDGRLDLAVAGDGGVNVFLNDGRGNLGPGDIEAPVITMLGADNVALTVNDPYEDAGATAADDVDGDISSRIVTENPVDSAVVGTYTITYRVTDLSGNAAQPVQRTVEVRANAQSSGGGGGATGVVALLWLVSLVLGRRLRLMRGGRL